MDSRQVIERVDGLNSPSTLKRWIREINRLTGTSFKKKTKYCYEYSNEDVQRFQEVAKLKTSIGLDNAILSVFGKGREPPVLSDEQILILKRQICDLKKENDANVKYIENDMKLLKTEIRRVNERLEIVERKKSIFKLR